jgi:hypothetical protein
MGGGGGSGGGGKERISTSAAKTQLTAKQKSLSRSLVGQLPGMASLMGNISLASQQKALDQGGTAIAVPGTSFAAQGQRYSQSPGQTPAEFQGRIAATKPGKGSSMGYVGDVAGVTKTTEIMGIPVTTFTGKTGYSPTGEKMAEPTGGGKETPTAPVTEPEVTPEVTPEIVPDDTVLASKTRRTRFKRAGQGGTILEGFGALYK